MPSTASTPVSMGMRRKRDDDESQASSATGIDSMLPVVQPRKRRKTAAPVMRAFQTFNLQREYDDSIGIDDYINDADSSQAVNNDEEGNGNASTTTTTSSLEDVPVEEDEDHLLLSDREMEQRKVNRKVMLELVFGADTKSPVDVKLQSMIRTSVHQTSTPTTTTTTTTSAAALPAAMAMERETLDDMNIDTPYSRPSAPMLYPTLHRSNSLPDIFAHDTSDQMDTD